MSVRALIKDIRLAANDSTARDRQYANSVFDLTFNRITTTDECYSSIEDAILNSRGRKGAPLTAEERKFLNAAVKKAFNNVYTARNIKNVHKKKGYKIFTNPNPFVGQTALAKYAGFQQRGPSAKKLAVYLPGGMITVNSLGPTVTYAGSMQTSKGGENRAVINALWFTMVREALKLSRAAAKRKTPKTVKKGYAAKRIGSDSRGSSRALRLHGPTASQDANGSTGETNDTSVSVVSLVETLQDIKAEGMKLPEKVTSQTMYNQAFKDVIAELDNQFIINSETISSIVGADKIIRIQLHQGGDQHQSYMTHADKKSVDAILVEIKNKLLNSKLGLTNPQYEASKSIAQMSQEAVLGQVVTNFFTKSGKPDMRFKVNRKASFKRGTQKTSETGSFNQKKKGKIISKGTSSAKKGTKRSSSTGIMGVGVAGATTSPIALKELIQVQLAERLLDNMKTPALNNRTGRLRRSAQVQNVMVGPRGGTEVQYTYMKDPYATFEPGGDMASTDRDPRRLIGGTIREIAMELTGNKFIRTRSL